VRKRVIRILGDITLNHPECPRRAEMTQLLLSRMKENNVQIVKLVSSTFEELWFGDSETVRHRVASKGECGGQKVYSRPFRDLVAAIIASIDAEAAQSDDPLRCGGQHVVDLVVAMLDRDARRGAKKRAGAHSADSGNESKVASICEDMVAVVVDKLLRFDLSTQSARRWAQIKPLVAALAVFSRARPILLAPHFVAIQSFIVALPKVPQSAAGDQRARAVASQRNAIAAVSQLAQILTVTIPLVARADATTSSTKQLQNALSQLLWGNVARECIEAAFEGGFYCDLIRALCAVIRHLSRDYKLATQRLLEMPLSALRALRRDAVWPKIGRKLDSAPMVAMKALVVMGTASKYYDADALDADCRRAATSAVDRMYEMYLHLMRSRDPRLQRFREFAVQGFSGLFCRAPELLNRAETLEVLRSFLSPSLCGSERVQCKTLEALHEFFRTEEQRTEFLQSEAERGTDKLLRRRHIVAAALIGDARSKSGSSSEGDDAVLSDAELSDEADRKRATGQHLEVAGIRSDGDQSAAGSASQSDTGHLIAFIGALSPSVLALVFSKHSVIRSAAGRVLLDWTRSSWANPVELIKHLMALCLDPECARTREMALCALSTIVERTPSLFQMQCVEGVVAAFSVFDAMATDFIGFAVSERDTMAAAVCGRVLPENVCRIMQCLDEMTKGERQRTVSAVTRSVTNYMADHALCVKRAVLGKRSHFAVPRFVAFLCHFMAAMPFETASKMEPFEVVKAVDASFETIGDLKKTMAAAKEDAVRRVSELNDGGLTTPSKTPPDRRQSEKALLKSLRALFQHSSHCLTLLILRDFRRFWAKLWNLSEAAVSLFKLNGDRNNKTKHVLRAKRTAAAHCGDGGGGSKPMLFELELEGKETVAERMKTAYDRLFRQNKVRTPVADGTASRETVQYEIPRILLDVEALFTAMAESEYARDLGLCSQTDSELISEDEESGDVDMAEAGDTNQGAKRKAAKTKATKTKAAKTKAAKTKAKQPPKRRKLPPRRARKTRRRPPVSSEEEESEGIIEYADTSTEQSSDSESDFDI